MLRLIFKDQKINIPIPAPNISKVTSTIRIKDGLEGICFRMIVLSEPTSKMPINKNGDSEPLMERVKCRRFRDTLMNNDLTQAAMTTWAAKDLPARLLAEDVAKLLHCTKEDVGLLVTAGKIKP
jgi:hypothetical protein